MYREQQEQQLYQEQQYTPQSIASCLQRFQRQQPDTSGPKNGISYWRGQTAEMLGKNFGQIAKLTKGWSLDKIRSRYYYVQKEGNNPAALWWHLWKQDRLQNQTHTG
jgi:hypothetical protein